LIPDDLAADRGIRAGEATRDEMNSSEIRSSNCFDIIKPLHCGPVLRKHSASIIILLNLPNGFTQTRRL
jgi:hypothetical protein